MTDAELLSTWYLALGIVSGIVVAAAALLIAILLAARRILKRALAALELVQEIKANTQSIWSLKTTNDQATLLLEAAESIRDHGALVAGALAADDQENVA